MSPSPHGSSRRSVLKSAAWTAPVIVAATAVPAYAVSPARIAVSSMTATRGGNGLTGRTINVQATLTNRAADPTSLLRVVLTVTLGSSAQWETLGPLTPASATATGYSRASVAGSGTTRTFTFTATSQLGGLDSYAFNATINTGSGTTPTGVVVLEAQPSGTTPAPGNGSGTATISG